MALSGLNLRAPANRVSRRALSYWTLRAVFTWVVIGAVEVLILYVGGSPVSHRMRGVIDVVSVVVALSYIVVMPQWRYRVHRWEATGSAVYTQTGWFTQERRIAPVSRIQTVDSHRGPLEQLLRLANVTVTTASAAGPLKIHGLDRGTADRLVAELTTRTEANTEDAT
ncbi:MAG: PH domain-containing protein [Nocardioidaceae bacterium]